MTRPTICLSMIVRDEAHIVREALASVLPYLDHWVVVDTGSTDETIAVVRAFFAEHGLPGEVVERPWRDFGANRSEALELCRGRADYAWVLDADDVLVGTPDAATLAALDADMYLLRVGEDFTYWRPQIFRLACGWRYEGVVHEYAVCDRPDRVERRLEGKYHVASRRLGARGGRPETYARDAALLRAELERRPDDTRSAFYLAQSLRDAGDLDGAIEWYGKRAAMGGWTEEVMYALLEEGRIRERRGDPWPEVLDCFLRSWAARPTRAEPLVEIARHYRSTGEHAPAHLFAERAAAIPFPDDDLLFVARDAYDWRAADELAIAAYWTGRDRQSIDLCTDLLSRRPLPEAERARIERNRDFAVERLAPTLAEHPADVVAALTEHVRAGRDGDPPITLTITSCRRLDLFERTVDSFLQCCLDHQRIDRWICVDDASSDADRARMQARYPFFEFVLRDGPERGHARGMNAILDRIETPYWIHLEDDWQFVVPDHYVAKLLEVLDANPSVGQVMWNRNYAEVLADRDLAGGAPRVTPGGLRYRIHTHADPGTPEYDRLHPAGARSNVWWPHYSLRPALLRTDAVRRVGRYDVDASHFELDYARRWTAAGCETAFLDGVHCIHIGRLTSERDGPRPNAYELNEQPQFGETPVTTRIRLLTSWDDPAAVLERWRRMTPGARGRWRGIELVAGDDAGDDDADLVLVVNHPADADADPDPARTIVASMEPSAGTARWGRWAAPDRRRYLQVRGHDRFRNLGEWHLALTYDELVDQVRAVTGIPKTADLSAVVSGRAADVGQRLRLDFVAHLEAHGVALDVWGRENPRGFRSYRGPLPPGAKDAGILPYRYTIAVENHAEPNYVTEKLFDAILGESLPFYWGCPNLEDEIDPAAFVRLPLEDLDASRRIVEQTIAADQWSARLPAIRAEKARFLEEGHLYAALARVAAGQRFVESLDVRVVNLDRRPDRWARVVDGLRTQAGEAWAARVRRHPAVDGLTLEATPELAYRFRGNDFGSRRGMIGCALSHLALWQEVADGDGRPCLVLEDDAHVEYGFGGLLVEAAGSLVQTAPGFDLLWLGYFPWPGTGSRRPGVWHATPRVRPMDWDDYMGGTFGYVVSRAGARRLLARAEADGVRHGIDWFVMRQNPDLRVWRTDPHLAWSTVAVPGSDVDSDVQHDHVGLT